MAEDIKAVNFDRRYRAEKKTLSVDTPENRFVRFALLSMKKQLLNIDLRFVNIIRIKLPSIFITTYTIGNSRLRNIYRIRYSKKCLTLKG